MKKVLKQVVEYVKEPHNVHLCGLPSERFRKVIEKICEGGGLGRAYKVVVIEMKSLLTKDHDSQWNLGVRIAKEISRKTEKELGEFREQRCKTADEFRDSLDDLKGLINSPSQTKHGIVFLWRHFDHLLEWNNEVGYDLYSALQDLIMKSNTPMIISSYRSLNQIQRGLGFGDNTDLARRFVERGMVWVKPDEEGTAGAINSKDYDRWNRLLQNISDVSGRSYLDIFNDVISDNNQVQGITKEELIGYGLLNSNGGAPTWAQNLFSQPVAQTGAMPKKTRQSGGQSNYKGKMVRKRKTNNDGAEVYVAINVEQSGTVISIGRERFRVTSARVWAFLDELIREEKRMPGKGWIKACGKDSNMFRGTNGRYDLKGLTDLKAWILWEHSPGSNGIYRARFKHTKGELAPRHIN